MLHYRGMDARIFSKRYLLHEQLGSGGEGVIYRATDRLTTRTVAVKRVRLETDGGMVSHAFHMNNANRKILIAHEFQTLATLRHPSIISVLDYGFSMDGEEYIPYFVMEYLPDAQPVVEAGMALSLEKKMALLIQMLQALHYLHQRGILHRDLKPANALVMRGQLKLLDFGLSAFVEKARGTSGTLPYMPPEFMQDEPLSAASDLYSVGVMGYELLAGRHPFRVHDPSQLVLDILFTDPDFGGIEAPDAICMILEKLMAKAPADRFQSAQEVILALSTALGQQLPRETEAIRESFLRQAAFVGRTAEMNQLLTTFNGLLSPNDETPRAWLIGGESGVGKSRLLQEFCAQVLVHGGVVLQGSVGEHPSPYQLWHDPLQLLAVLTKVDLEQASVLKAIVPDIERVLPGVPFVLEPMPLEGQAHISRILAVLRTLFLQLTQGDTGLVPVILVFEDTQWAGSESLALLREFQDVVTDLPVMLLATFHLDETPHLPKQFPAFEQMILQRLQASEVAALTQAMLGAGDPDLYALLYRETEGNVLFLVETLRTLAEETGSLADIGKRQFTGAVRAKGVEALLARRLERVPEEARPLLSFAAVLGRQFDPRLLTQNWKWRISWEQWLLALSNASIIQLSEGQWVFTHEKLRQVLLTQLPPRRLQALHALAAEGIEKAYPDQPIWGKLAFHWREAEVFDREFHYISLAGPYFLRTSAYREAVAVFERGLTLIETGLIEATHDQQAEFLLKRANALSSLGEYERADQAYQKALSFGQAHGVDQRVAEGYLGLAKNHDLLGNYREAQNFYGLALVIFEKAGDVKNAAHSRMGLGRVAFRLGSFDEAKLAYQVSLETFRAVGEKQGEGSVLCGLGDTARVQGDFVVAKQCFLAAQVVFQEIGNRDGMSVAFNNLGVLAETQGLFPEALEWHQKSLNIKREIGVRQGIAISLSNLGVVYYSLNDFATSRKYTEETATLYKALQDRQGLADSYNNLGLLDFYMRDFKQARDRLGLALDLCEQIGDQWGVALAHLNLGKVARELHALGVAIHHFSEALELAKILKLDSVILQTIIEYTPILLQAGECHRAVVHLSHTAHNPKTPGFERLLAGELLEEARKCLSDEEYIQADKTGASCTLDEIVQAVTQLFREGTWSQ